MEEGGHVIIDVEFLRFELTGPLSKSFEEFLIDLVIKILDHIYLYI